jgi:hypothetical protein
MVRTQRKEFGEVCPQAVYGHRCWTFWLFHAGCNLATFCSRPRPRELAPYQT